MRDKGTAELIEAACEVRPRHPEVRFVLLGDFDEDWERTVSHAVSAGIIEHVPFDPDVRSRYASCAALVHPSYHEGMSNVCLEAAATGRPVIASDVPGCRETFDEGVSGMGFEPRSAVARGCPRALHRPSLGEEEGHGPRGTREGGARVRPQDRGGQVPWRDSGGCRQVKGQPSEMALAVRDWREAGAYRGAMDPTRAGTATRRGQCARSP